MSARADANAPRVGLIGARRARQGLGPYVARDLRATGAEVPCFLCSRAETLAEAARELQHYGVEARGYSDLDDMLRAERLDAVAILSPSPTHERYLYAAADAGLHALCEKPLVWGGEDLAGRAHRAVARFRGAGLLLRENCQWPYTLGPYRSLHPPSGLPIERFAMRLSPSSTGLEALGDCLSHPLSLLQELVPGNDPRVEGVEFSEGSHPGSEAPRLTVAFSYRAAGSAVAVEVDLVQSAASPREAAFGVDGRWVERRVRGDSYSIRFESGSRSVEVRDPLGALVAAFAGQLRALRGGQGPEADCRIAPRMQMLDALVRAFRDRQGR